MRGITVLVGALMLTRGFVAAQTSLSVSYDAPAFLTLHEPVVMTVTIRNLLAEPVNLDLGWNRKEGFQIAVLSPDGRVQHPAITPHDVGRVGRISIAPNREYSQRLILDDWLPFDSVGRYRVEVRLIAPIRVASAAIDRPPADTVNIQIGPRDETVLRQTCEQLADRVSSIGEERYDAAQALGHIIDPAAIPCFRRVFEATEFADPILLEALGKIGAPEALSVLTELASSSSADRAALARNPSAIEPAAVTGLALQVLPGARSSN